MPRWPSTEERFWRSINATDEGCWEWVGSRSADGYGQFQMGVLSASGNHSPRKAHRVAYEFLVGPIPDGLQVDHLCRNRGCVNPSHLEPVTNQENTRRGKAVITHCPHGHAYTPENTVLRRGSRECLTCRRERDRARSGRKRRAA